VAFGIRENPVKPKWPPRIMGILKWNKFWNQVKEINKALIGKSSQIIVLKGTWPPGK